MRLPIEITNGLLLTLGILSITAGLLLPGFNTPSSTMFIRSIAAGKTSDVFLGLGTGLVSWVCIELVKKVNERIHIGEKERHFLALLGENALSRNNRGRVVVQADDVGQLLGELKGCSDSAKSQVLGALDNSYDNRLYKARTWVNAQDAKAARIIREGFRTDKFPTPELQIIENRRKKGTPAADPFKDHSAAPYVISLGLAWTETTRYLTDDFDLTAGSFYIDESTINGDALTVRGDHLQAAYAANIQTEEVPAAEVKKPYASQSLKFFRIYPMPWDHNSWKNNTGNVNDYAVIIRHTHLEGDHKQVRLILAGFTENGTAAAARCLVYRQNDLYKLQQRFKDDKENPDGDFVAVISGPAKAETAWNDDPIIGFSKIQDTRLQEQSSVGSRIKRVFSLGKP